MPARDDAAARGGDEPLLVVDGLCVEFETGGSTLNAVNGLSYSVDAGESIAILGESGSGKTVSSEALMGIVDMPPGRITAGSIRYRGKDLLKMPPAERRKLRGREMAMIFQDALTALNPGLTVGQQLGEMFRVHESASRSEARRRSIDMLERVGIPSAAERVDEYPMAFSGGMRQRVMIAMALALDPALIIADEPTTALDVTVQAQIIGLLRDLCEENNSALILITHDIGLAAEVASKVIVMYAGRAVERGPIAEVFASTAHPYTQGLMRSVPRIDVKKDELETIGGTPPDLQAIPSGCPFHPRCAYARDRCEHEEPPLFPVSPTHDSACLFVEEVIAHG